MFEGKSLHTTKTKDQRRLNRNFLSENKMFLLLVESLFSYQATRMLFDFNFCYYKFYWLIFVFCYRMIVVSHIPLPITVTDLSKMAESSSLSINLSAVSTPLSNSWAKRKCRSAGMLPITLRCHVVVLSLRNQIVEWLDSLIVKSD